MSEHLSAQDIHSTSEAVSSESAREEIAKAKKVAGRSAAKARGRARKRADGVAEPVAPELEAPDAGEDPAATVDEGEPPMSDDELVEVLPGVKPAHRRKVKEIVDRFFALGRKSTETAFEIGAMFLEVKGYMPDRLWRKWITRKCEMTVRSAENYMSLPAKLSRYKQQAIEHRVPSAALYVMANAEVAVIEELMGRYERGPRPTVAEVKAFVNGSAPIGEEAAPDPADVGGLTGLRALGMAKVKTGSKVFADRISGIIEAIEPALEPHWRGKRVGKSGLAKAIQYEARRARSELQSVATFVEPFDGGPIWNVHPVPFPVDSGWRKVSDILYKLGGVESWPAADEVGTWLVEEVIPMLEWAIGRKPKADAKPDASASTEA